MANFLPNRTSFKKGQKRSVASRKKQSDTMKRKYKDGTLKIPIKFKREKGVYYPPKKSRVCEICQKTYLPNGGKQRWCSVCVPDVRFRRIAQRYGIGYPEWKHLLIKQLGKCALCGKKPRVVDHCHKSKKVRGLLCDSCNLLMSALDRDGWLDRALVYLRKSK